MEEGNLMHQQKNFKSSLTRAGLSIRLFSLSMLLMGSLLAFFSAIASEQVFAQGSPQMSQHHLTKVLHSVSHADTQVLKSHKGSLQPQKDTTHAIGAIVMDTPTATATAMPTAHSNGNSNADRDGNANICRPRWQCRQ